jgi:hypothetical protein
MSNNVLQALLEIPLLVGEVELLQQSVKEGIITTTPGVGTSIEGVPGKISLTFTPSSTIAATSSTHGAT